MEERKMETVTSTPATNFCNTTTTENQNPPALLENQYSTAILENQNSPVLLENQKSTATLKNQYPQALLEYQNSTAIVENKNSTALLKYHQSNYAGAASSSKVMLGDPRMNAYFQSLPPGFRFKPTEEELIMHYLGRKIKNKQLYPSRIHDADIYEESPFYLSENYVAATENEWYFLSPRKKKYLNGERPDRAAGNGFWKATDADKSIKSSKHNGEVGVVKTLKYFVGRPKNCAKSSWIMKEYRIKKSRQSKYSEGTMKLDEYVLCKIYEHNKDKSDATNGVQGEANDQDQPAENFHDGVAQQLNYHQDHGPADGLLVTGDHINQQNHGDNTRDIDISAGQQQQQQQQQVWPIPNPSYLDYYNAVFPNDMSMPSGHQMHGNNFYPENHDLMQHETLYGQQTVSDHDIAYDNYIPQGFPHAILPGADAFNNVQALNNESNTSQGFSSDVQPVADGSNDVQGFNNEMNVPQMQQRQYQHRLVMTRPSPSSRYHPYHPQN
ncbi:hypothetical protein POM88_009689 [Heracleum sosnowskyi]|uniref:NAC domain-containing protein n=1 Tax=Heracleum sosnowskyi TaxID=360622 RepID=A0AAD8N8N1_9APIA|nr:hypothetical protein POM88_009689 [Heracleum sosnowskyi]